MKIAVRERAWGGMQSSSVSQQICKLFRAVRRMYVSVFIIPVWLKVSSSNEFCGSGDNALPFQCLVRWPQPHLQIKIRDGKSGLYMVGGRYVHSRPKGKVSEGEQHVGWNKQQ